MLKTDVFDYINIMDKAADAAWLRNDAISNNIANNDTPGYKRQDVAFERELQRALGYSHFETMDGKVSDVNKRELSRITPSVYTEQADHSYRLDGNNVDIDTENVYLAENQITYNTLLDSINMEFKNLKMVMK
ncbi:MAG: flagellar basal body rod protein FlgB [Lachnospiraceae bacterium]|nr:flagellar basal body rod protein FlgB [Lachnospiraceae bacterium]